MTFEAWQQSVPSDIQGDALWRIEAYRLALFLSDLAWADCTKLQKDVRTREIAGQLFRSTGRVSAQIAEGYSRTSSKERALYYSYALGSLRESRDWYYKARVILGEKVSAHRLATTTSIIRLTLTMLGSERRTKRRLDESV